MDNLFNKNIRNGREIVNVDLIQGDNLNFSNASISNLSLSNLITNGITTSNILATNISTANLLGISLTANYENILIGSTITKLNVREEITSGSMLVSNGNLVVNDGDFIMIDGAANIEMASSNEFKIHGSDFGFNIECLGASEYSYTSVIGLFDISFGVGDISHNILSGAYNVALGAGAMNLVGGAGTMNFMNGTGLMSFSVGAGGYLVNALVGALNFEALGGVMSFDIGAGGLFYNIGAGGLLLNSGIGVVDYTIGLGGIDINSNLGTVTIGVGMGLLSLYSGLGGISINSGIGQTRIHGTHVELLSGADGIALNSGILGWTEVYGKGWDFRTVDVGCKNLYPSIAGGYTLNISTSNLIISDNATAQNIYIENSTISNSIILNQDISYATIGSLKVIQEIISAELLVSTGNVVITNGSLIVLNDISASNVQVANNLKSNLSTISSLYVNTSAFMTSANIGYTMGDSNNSALLKISTQYTSGHTVLNDPVDILSFSRLGKFGESWSQRVKFALSRYEDVSTHSRTRMDMYMTHDQNMNNVNVLTFYSNGLISTGSLSLSGHLSVGSNINTYNVYGNSFFANDIIEALSKMSSANMYCGSLSCGNISCGNADISHLLNVNSISSLRISSTNITSGGLLVNGDITCSKLNSTNSTIGNLVVENNISSGNLYGNSFFANDTIEAITKMSSANIYTGFLSCARGKITIQGGLDGTAGAGLYYWNLNDTNWCSYFASAGLGKSIDGGTACNGVNFTSYAIRNRVVNGSGYGFIWENSSNECLMSLQGGGGNLYVKGLTTLGNTLLVSNGNVVITNGSLKVLNDISCSSLQMTGDLSGNSFFANNTIEAITKMSSANIYCGSLSCGNISCGNVDISNLLNTNSISSLRISSTNITSGGLLVNGNITCSRLNAANSTIGNLVVENNISSSNIFSTTRVSSANLNCGNLSSSNLIISNLTTLGSTLISNGSLTITNGSLYVLNNISASNISAVNHLSAGSDVRCSNDVYCAVLYASYCASSANTFTGNITANSGTLGNILVSTGNVQITNGNLSILKGIYGGNIGNDTLPLSGNFTSDYPAGITTITSLFTGDTSKKLISNSFLSYTTSNTQLKTNVISKHTFFYKFMYDIS